MLDLGGIPLHGKDRTLDHPLVIAGGPGAQNPELLAPFVDLFIIGDGEESLPWIMEQWMTPEGAGARHVARADMLAGHRRQHRLGPTRRCSTSRSTTPTAPSPPCTAPAPMCRARSWPAPSRRISTPSRCRPGRSCSFVQDAARPHRHRDHARLSRGSAASANRPSSNGRCASAPSRPSCRRPWTATATPASTRSACSACRTSDYPYFEELVQADARGVRAAGRQRVAAEPAHQPPAAVAAEADEGRAQGAA